MPQDDLFFLSSKKRKQKGSTPTERTYLLEDSPLSFFLKQKRNSAGKCELRQIGGDKSSNPRSANNPLCLVLYLRLTGVVFVERRICPSASEASQTQ